MSEIKPCPFCGGCWSLSDSLNAYGCTHEDWCVLFDKIWLIHKDDKAKINQFNQRADGWASDVPKDSIEQLIEVVEYEIEELMEVGYIWSIDRANRLRRKVEDIKKFLASLPPPKESK